MGQLTDKQGYSMNQYPGAYQRSSLSIGEDIIDLSQLASEKYGFILPQEQVDIFVQRHNKLSTNQNIADLVVGIGAASSKREAREFISSGAVSVNGEKVSDISLTVSDEMFIDNTYIIIKRGKKNYYIGRK